MARVDAPVKLEILIGGGLDALEVFLINESHYTAGNYTGTEIFVSTRNFWYVQRFFVSAENHRRGDFCVENNLATENCWLSRGYYDFGWKILFHIFEISCRG